MPAELDRIAAVVAFKELGEGVGSMGPHPFCVSCMTLSMFVALQFLNKYNCFHFMFCFYWHVACQLLHIK